MQPSKIFKENPTVDEDLQTIISSIYEHCDFFSGQRCFVTGGTGLVGSYLVRALLLANDIYDLDLVVSLLTRKPILSDSRLYPWLQHASLEVVYGSVETFDFSQLPCSDIIIHAASQASPKFYQVDPIGTLMPNCLGTLRLCEQAADWGSKKFLYFSSSEVYGVATNIPLLETDFGLVDPVNTRSCYSESKRMGEAICKAYSLQNGLNTTSVRLFHTYGPQMSLDDGRVFADFVRDALQGSNIRIASTGRSLRSFCYLSDAIRGLITLLVNGAPGESYNLANPGAEISILDLANLLAKLSPHEISIEFSNSFSTKPGYINSNAHRVFPSIDKIKSLGWLPEIGIHDGFKRTLFSYSHAS